MLKKLELKFLRLVIDELDKDTWDETSLNKIYKNFLKFSKKIETDELSLLRFGEVFLRECINVTTINKDNSKSIILSILNNIEELEIPVVIVMIAAIVKLSLCNDENKED
jgi:hypothetical protein